MTGQWTRRAALGATLALPFTALAAVRQTRPGLYRCDGCEVAEAHEAANLDPDLVLPPDGEPGEPLLLQGRVLAADGETPAAGVVLYFHQTNADGYYRSHRSTGRGGRHDGMIQGWLATNADGRYRVETIRPAPYPGLGVPAHIHVYVKEPGRRPYYLDDFVFTDDPLVDDAYVAAQELRGGSGIVKLDGDAGGWRAARDIVLEP